MQLKQIGMAVITLITLGALAGCGTVNGTTSATNGTSAANNTGNTAYSSTHSNETGTTSSVTNETTNTAGNSNNPTPVSNLVAIQGTVQKVNSQGSDTNVTILISKMKHTGTISSTYLKEFGNNQSVTITFSGTPSSYGLKVSPRQRMMMYLTPAIMKTKKAHWDGYEYDKNGQYVNWKGQDITFS